MRSPLYERTLNVVTVDRILDPQTTQTRMRKFYLSSIFRLIKIGVRALA